MPRAGHGLEALLASQLVERLPIQLQYYLASLGRFTERFLRWLEEFCFAGDVRLQHSELVQVGEQAEVGIIKQGFIAVIEISSRGQASLPEASERAPGRGRVNL